MTPRTVKIPDENHPISIRPSKSRIVISVAGQTIADTQNSLTLYEAAYPAVHYIPRADVNMAWLQASALTTYCPYKGECAYYHIPIGGERAQNAVWSYETPFPAVSEIKGYLAFYADRIDSLAVLPA